MPTITNTNGTMDPEEEDMDQEEDNDDRKSSEEETASGSGEGEEDQDEDEDEGGSSEHVLSEMDEEECDRRKTECIDDMNELSSQFCKLKDQLFNEREAQLEHKLRDLDRGTDPEYLYRLKHLEETRKHRLLVAEILYNLKVATIQEKFQAEELASLQHMESEKDLAYDQIKNELEEKVKRLEDDRHNIDISSDLYQIQNQRKKKRHDPFSSDRRKKPVQVNGPYLVYMLRDEEIIDDWTNIKRATKQQAQRRKVEL